MKEIGIALDLGTSGFRAQAINIKDGTTLSTAITLRHPLPGGNVIDHLQFATEAKAGVATRIIIDTVNKMLKHLFVDLTQVERLAVSGNPAQLSLFQNTEIRDLVIAGKKSQTSLGIENVDRSARIIKAAQVGLNLNPETDVYIPPAIQHEVGADTLAVIVKAGLLEKKGNLMVTDYGTNAEIALKVGDEIYTGSAAAGPAMEGQEIECGMLAAPGAISDIQPTESGWALKVLDSELKSRAGDQVDPRTGTTLKKGDITACGITGTGVIAAIAVGMDSPLIDLPKIVTPDQRIHLQDGFFITQKDLNEAGKAFGAFTAGHIAMAETAGISLGDIEEIYMAGASGTYVDPVKAQRVGLVPPAVKKAIQIGNTSLAMACDIVKNPEMLDDLQKIAEQLKRSHVMFATSKHFENAYLVALGLWSYMSNKAMTLEMANKVLEKFKIKPIPPIRGSLESVRIAMRDIPVLGKKGLAIVTDVGMELTGQFEDCSGCETCANECPEKVLRVVNEGGSHRIIIRSSGCLGLACRKCETVCPQMTLKISKLSSSSYKAQ